MLRAHVDHDALTGLGGTRRGDDLVPVLAAEHDHGIAHRYDLR